MALWDLDGFLQAWLQYPSTLKSKKHTYDVNQQQKVTGRRTGSVGATIEEDLNLYTFTFCLFLDEDNDHDIECGKVPFRSKSLNSLGTKWLTVAHRAVSTRSRPCCRRAERDLRANNNTLPAPLENCERGTEYRKAQCRHLLNDLLPRIAHRVVSTRGNSQSRRPERAIKLDNSVICIFLGEDRVLRTECRDVQDITCSSSCFGKR